jgi:hypothetical protein
MREKYETRAEVILDLNTCIRETNKAEVLTTKKLLLEARRWLYGTKLSVVRDLTHYIEQASNKSEILVPKNLLLEIISWLEDTEVLK